MSVDTQPEVSLAVNHRWRWLIPALLLPLAIAASNHIVLSWVYSLRSPLQTTACFLLFVFQVGAASVFAGRFLSGWQRWLIFGWTLLILDVMTFTIAITGHSTGEILAFALISGQLGTLAIWGILGAERWVLRVPFAIAGLLTATLFWNRAFSLTQLWGNMYYLTTWIGLVVLQLALLGGICIFLRWQGCRLSAINANGMSSANAQNSIWQFHLREILLQTAIVAIVITVIRATFPSPNGYSNPISIASVGLEFLVSLGLVLVMISALWTVLGQQITKTRLALFVAMIATVGASLGFSAHLLVSDPSPSLRYRSWWWIVQLDWWWLPWTCLAAGFLAATLWIFREAGYRLIYADRTSSSELG